MIFMSDIMKKQFYQKRLDFERMSALFDSQHSMPEDVVEEKNIAYLPDAKNVHELDVFYPVRSVKQPIPVMVNIHGGGLLIGNKEFNRFFCARFSELGYLVFSVEYPLVPDCQVYDQFAAIAAALKYIKEHLSESGQDLRNCRQRRRLSSDLCQRHVRLPKAGRRCKGYGS